MKRTTNSKERNSGKVENMENPKAKESKMQFPVGVPVQVKVVTHHAKDDFGQRLGSIGYVQRRDPAKAALHEPNKPFAAWVRRVVGGVETGAPQRARYYKTAEEAQAHAEYAASVAPAK